MSRGRICSAADVDRSSRHGIQQMYHPTPTGTIADLVASHISLSVSWGSVNTGGKMEGMLECFVCSRKAHRGLEPE